VVYAVGVLWPQHLALANRYSFPALLGELVFTLWLLVMGAKPRLLAPASA